MDYVAERTRNPFGMDPPCERFVPGYGDTTAHFHVVGDHPGVHGGLETGIPFTGQPWSGQFLGALARGGIVGDEDPATGDLPIRRTFLSYLHMCDPGGTALTDADYAALEPYFDAELRAITAHVLLPVGPRPTAHILREYTSTNPETVDISTLHAEEVRGRGWLVVPIRDPTEWTDGDADALVRTLRALRASGYEQTSDLGRFFPDEEAYLVR